MKTLAQTYINLLFLLASSFMIAQTYTLEDTPSSQSNLQNSATQFSHISSQLNKQNNLNRSTTSNNIYVQQVGNYNNVNTLTFSRSSDINLLQFGNNNEVILDVKAQNITETVIQKGYDHSFIDLSSSNARIHNAAVIQNGRNQNLIWYGNNSISEKMAITMRGKNQTIIVRNLK